MKSSNEVAGEYESKFRFYFVALTFTLLAASIQSAPLSEMSCVNKIIEITGWLFLLICGFSSLSFLEYSSVIYKNRAIAENQEKDETTRTESKEVAREIGDKSTVKYFIAKWSFVIGLILVMISRATHGFTNI